MKNYICAAALLLAVAPYALPQNLAEFSKHVTEFTLDNGLHFIVVERHRAPVVSFHTFVNAGAVDDPQGRTGLAHMFEHMAFKGTAEIGSNNWVDEQKAMAEIEKRYAELDAERVKGTQANPAHLTAIEADLKGSIEKAAALVDTNLYPRVIEENGGAGLNASTGEDSTNFFYSLPSNRTELWFLLESSRFKDPVFREFYKERNVVREERRMRSESEPQGKLIEALGAAAMEAHPYRRPPVGWASDIEDLRVSDAQAFFQTYYAPANITISIVGDIDPAAVRAMATKYFGPLTKRPLPPRVSTTEPLQEGAKSVEVLSEAQPIEFIAYKRPNGDSPEDPVFDVITSILSGGRTGLLYKSLVRDSRVALAAGADASYPGDKYPCLFLLYLVPAMNHSLAENEKALYAVIDSLKNTKVDPETLTRVKTKTRAGLIRQLDSNSGLASLLATYQGSYGDWRKLFSTIEDINKVTADDVQRVAKTYFVESSRTTAFLKPPAAGPIPGVAAGDAK